MADRRGVAEELFPVRDPLEKDIRVGGKRFTVVGVLESKGSIFGESMDALVIIPVTTFEKSFGSRRSVVIDCSPAEDGLPGSAYFAGTHFNPNITWWKQAGAFVDYLNRCHFLLQQGLPVCDVLHFYGENIPAFVRLKRDESIQRRQLKPKKPPPPTRTTDSVSGIWRSMRRR